MYYAVITVTTKPGKCFQGIELLKKICQLGKREVHNNNRNLGKYEWVDLPESRNITLRKFSANGRGH